MKIKLNFTVIKFIILIFFAGLTESGFAQNSAIKFVQKGLTFDNHPDIYSLDESYPWTDGLSTGILTFGVEYQKFWKNNFSLKPHIGYAGNRTNYVFSDSTSRITKYYFSRYINFGISCNYHFKKKLRGFQIGIGPSVYTMIDHRISYPDNQSVTFNNSLIRDRLNTIPIMLQAEFAYSFKVLKLFGVVWDFELGYAPAIKLNGFINENPASIILPRGLRFSINILQRDKTE